MNRYSARFEIICNSKKNRFRKKIETVYPQTDWLEDPEKYEYVRESDFTIGTGEELHDLPIFFAKDRKVIGWCFLSQGSGLRKGVIWYLKNYDRGMPDAKKVYGKKVYGKHPKTYMPSEAVFFK